MHNHLERLSADLVTYRESVDRLFSPRLSKPKDWRKCFSQVLICVSQLYLDYLLVTKESASFKTIRHKSFEREAIEIDIQREKALRDRLREHLESRPPWKHFTPENEFSGDTGLRTLQDYTNRFALHLSEVYEETFRLEEYARMLQTKPYDWVLSSLLVGLQHIGRNHISFVQQALEWAADETGWDI